MVRVKFEFDIRTEEKVLEKGSGECQMKDPVMVTAQIPIEKEQYDMLKAACQKQKLTIYDLLKRALNQTEEDIRFIF